MLPTHAQNVITASLDLGHGTRHIHLYDTLLSQTVLKEVFSGQSYPLFDFLGPMDVIVDIGANIGVSTVYFALSYPQSKVLAYEPSPYCYELILKNTKDLEHVEAYNFGLAQGVERTARLYLGEQDSVLNSFGQSSLNPGEFVEATIKDAHQVMQDHGIDKIDLLKIDTEGSEGAILASLKSYIPEVKVAYIEYHHSETRLDIDKLFTPTHVLFQGKITSPHRGELCYVAKHLIPEDAPFSQWGVRI